jgi:hypothetical protein
MSSRRHRLTQKLEGLNDEATEFLETQIDLLLTMPEFQRRDRWVIVRTGLERLEQIEKRPATVHLLPAKRSARR